MKNLISPEILASFKKDPVPVQEIVDFLDTNSQVKITHLCRIIGIPPRMIYDFRSYANRKNKKITSTVLAKAASKAHNRYSAEDKLSLCKSYLSANDEEKATLLRKYGLYSSDIARWWEQIDLVSIEALSKRKIRSDKVSAEQLEIKELKCELLEQEKTTAKLSTLLVLQKKTFELLKNKG